MLNKKSTNVASKSFFFEQVVPLSLTVVMFGIFTLLLHGEIVLLNHFTKIDIIYKIHLTDVLIGMTIYLKTSVDFALFIGNLMHQFPGWRNRVSIEIGTAAGNALGTMIILAVWNFFRDIEWLLAIMIFIASLVLLRLAEDGLEHARAGNGITNNTFYKLVEFFSKILVRINGVTNRFLKYIIPNIGMKAKDKKLTFAGLFIFSFTVPFILGLDDFAGYVPLFNIVNVFGFAIGVFAGHMILNLFLFLSPTKTIQVVKNPIISFIGSIVFVGLAIWGFREAWHLLVH